MEMLELEITPELFVYVEERVAREGMSVEAWIAETITSALIKTLAEAIAPYVVPVEGREPLLECPENDHGAQFAEALATKKRDGHF